AGRAARRDRRDRRQCAAVPGLAERSDDEYDDPAMASRVGLGRRACAPLPGRGSRTRARRRERSIGGADTADVDRRGALARYVVLRRARGAHRRGVRVVDVPAVLWRAISLREPRTAARGAREPDLLDERGAASAAVDD